MHIYTYSDARKNLKLILDKVVEDAEVALITRKDRGHAVVMGRDYYDSIMETLYLLSSPNNANRLNESIVQLRSGQIIECELIEDE
ncbi:type II toxin-antitoxin system prevent-host-death family antitoxin [Ignatzschineria ureiclastica]|uniref:Antitoxin n=1 Tax=Ignatzschineria ureiclastica TaxID=472582 RepID=A0A2U2AGN9_9GAMM|nr:type II toxin-antitoxin system prevent-host-death family antitoxin [Ignatzschineria ureiclastica]PWD81749.1 type II toxin-antitoxin system prevent-host-death family antitoxin [Ignatzschineria ureiclastica]GGZ90255.1 antitoxin [Ignatzschineria ureiclastica]